MGKITAHVSRTWLIMNLSEIWYRLSDVFNSFVALVIRLFQRQPMIQKDVEAVKSQILEESVAADPVPTLNETGEVQEKINVEVVDEKTSKTSFLSENVSEISLTVYSNIAKSITKSFQVQEILEEKLQNQEKIIVEEKMEINDSYYALDSTSVETFDDSDEEKKQNPDILADYTGAFRNYIDLVVQTDEVVQTVELESDQWKQAVRLRPFKSTDRVQEWTTDLNSSDHDLENIRIVVDGSQISSDDIEKIKKDDGTVQFTIKHK